jgi:hypothetical protein
MKNLVIFFLALFVNISSYSQKDSTKAKEEAYLKEILDNFPN